MPIRSLRGFRSDAERLLQHPTLRLIGWEKIWEHGAAVASRLQSFETDRLTQEENFAGLVAMSRERLKFLVVQTLHRFTTYARAARSRGEQ